MIFHDGFRWGIGTDWDNYYEYFMSCLSGSSESFEPGYVAFNQLVRSTTDNYSVFLILHAIIVYLLISYSIFKHSVNPFFSFFLFYCFMLGYLGMNRQYISLAICIFSYKFILERKFVLFLISVLIASLFHLSCLVFLCAYFFNKRWSSKYIIALLSAAVIISLSGIINKLPLNLFFLFGTAIGDKMDFYSGTFELNTNIVFTILALLKRSIWIVLGITFRDFIKNRDKNYDFFFNLYFVGSIVYVLFNNTVLQIIVAREVLYFNIAEIFLIPYILTIFQKGATKYLVFGLTIIYAVSLMVKNIDFYKKDLGVDIFRPYNSVLIDDTYNAMHK